MNVLTSTVVDDIFWKCKQQVFEEVKYLVQSSIDGFNVCIFAYGQTGSGKTFTIYGNNDNPGIQPRACDELFSILKRDKSKYTFEIQVLKTLEREKKTEKRP